ncbi:MAG: hypothetical protein IPL28_26875 [Chloroflexi bacterium]|nr:hypothetical protein [Chloroflexota bacterium]
MSFQIRMNYPRRWAMIFWITAVLLVWLITYAVRQGELLLAEQRATAEIATWLATTSSAEARVMAEAPIAGRPHLPLPHAANLAQTRPWLTALQQTQPEWVVGDGSIGWQFIAQTAWFTSHYTVAYERPPYTVWQRTAEPLPPLEPLALDIGGQTTLVGSYISPTVVQTGQEVAVTLAFSATQTLSRTFTTHLELRSGATVVASTSQTTPTAIPLGWWDAPLVVQETFLLNLGQLVDSGTYTLVASFKGNGQRDEAVWPLRQGETTAYEWVLGTVSVP